MPPATVRRAPYKDFLQPALHRRFTTTASILLLIAYFQAVFFGLAGSSVIWALSPIGPTTVRTLFLSVCGLSVIVLRIAQYHVGVRTSSSAFQSFAQTIFTLPTAEAIFTYVFSGWLFSQLWLWSRGGPDSGLAWITYFSGDRARLNEKPLFFTCYFVVLGVIQALLHLFYDNDRLSLGVVKPGAKQVGGDSASQLKEFLAKWPSLLLWSGGLQVCTVLVAPVAYVVFMRGPVWRTSLLFLRPFYNLPKTNMMPSSWPFNFWVLGKCAFAGFLVAIVWQAGNAAFSIFLVREPLKHGKPLTSESKDPNGSLLNGLKSRKLPFKCFAMWELAFIARDYEVRRKLIYEDIDRTGGPMWSQVYAICLEVIKSMEFRMDNYGQAPAPAAPASTAVTTVSEKKRTTQPPKQDEIVQATPTRKTFLNEVEKAVGQVATAPGQPSQLSPLARKAMASAKEKVLQLQKDATGRDDTRTVLQDMALKVLATPLGWPFRQEFSRRLAAAVLGTPYGEPSLYINAVNALTLLAVHSLSEDKYGNVQRDVAGMLRTLTTVTSKLERFRHEFPCHWTDVEKDRTAAEVDSVLDALREGLAQLVEAFGPYARDLRLSLTDMRLAREAAGIERDERLVRRDEEMREVR